MAEHLRPALVEREQRAHQADERRLAAAVRPQHAVDLATVDREGDVVHGQHRLLLAAHDEPLRQVLHEERRHTVAVDRSPGQRRGPLCRRGGQHDPDIGLWLFKDAGHVVFLGVGHSVLVRCGAFRTWKEPRVLVGPRLLVFAAGQGNKKAVDPIRPTTRGVWLAALPPFHQLEMGTDLPSTPPLDDGRSHRAIGVLMRRCIAFRLILVVVIRAQVALAGERVLAESTSAAWPLSRLPGICNEGAGGSSCQAARRLPFPRDPQITRLWAHARRRASALPQPPCHDGSVVRKTLPTVTPYPGSATGQMLTTRA